jgi:hypothetical protein
LMTERLFMLKYGTGPKSEYAHFPVSRLLHHRAFCTIALA